jgi:hypothetical protein
MFIKNVRSNHTYAQQNNNKSGRCKNLPLKAVQKYGARLSIEFVSHHHLLGYRKMTTFIQSILSGS